MNLEKIIGLRNDKTIYKDGFEVIKVFNENYSKAQVLNEALNHARVEETNLLVPKLLSVSNEDGKWIIKYQYIQGKTLEQIILEANDHLEEYLEVFVNLQIRVHNIDGLMLNKLKDRLNYKIEQSDLLATTRYELRRKLETMPKHQKLCHGDFNPSNIIVTNSGEYYIIDWAHATSGNASADSAITYLEFLLNYNQAIADKYLEIFCLKTNTSKNYCLSWLPIVAAARLVKATKQEKKLLLSIINLRNN